MFRSLEELLFRLPIPGRDGIGDWGERQAARYLVRTLGFRVLARNWTNPADNREELDLVCLDGPVLVFVEVKTRAANANVRGYDAVDFRKKRALQRAVLAYLRQLHPRDRPRALRLDIVEVNHHGSQAKPQILHFPNAPLLGRHFHTDRV